jgi:hypothetical protein
LRATVNKQAVASRRLVAEVQHEDGSPTLERIAPSRQGTSLFASFYDHQGPAEAENNVITRQGVIEFFQTQTHTKMTIAAERLAVIAAVTLPITALSSVMGMNVIVNDRTDPVFLTILLLVMSAMSILLLVWARRAVVCRYAACSCVRRRGRPREPARPKPAG